MKATGSWVCYRTVFAAEAPVHIGWHRLGLIERTRYYIPARAIWGALVATLAPRLNGHSGVPAMYRDTEEEFKKSVRFTCFFATDSIDPAAEVWRPKYEHDGLHYGTLSAADFESRFVYSQTSAALNPSTFTALDGALHESEFLCYTGEAGPATKALHFVGYLIFKESLAPSLETGLASISVGADRNYGWGKLRLRCFEQVTTPLFGEFELVSAATEAPPKVKATFACEQPGFVPAHVLRGNAGPEESPQLQGDLELVGGRDWAAKGSGQGFETLALCWAPGSRVVSMPAVFEIGERGLWSVSA